MNLKAVSPMQMALLCLLLLAMPLLASKVIDTDGLNINTLLF